MGIVFGPGRGRGVEGVDEVVLVDESEDEEKVR